MRKFLMGVSACLVLAVSPVASQAILKAEPPAGGLMTGQKVLVDNGRCPKGQVMEVSGGTFPSQAQRNAAAAAGGSLNAGGQPRQRRCVARPG